jgi:hypothetical protein
MDSGIPDRNDGTPTFVYNDERWSVETIKTWSVKTRLD